MVEFLVMITAVAEVSNCIHTYIQRIDDRLLVVAKLEAGGCVWNITNLKLTVSFRACRHGEPEGV